MNNCSVDSYEDWYVVFTKSKLDHWIFKIIHPSFQHCYVVKRDYGLWIVLDSNNAMTTVRTELVDEYPHIRDLCKDSVILLVRARIDRNKNKWHFGVNSCVDVCKGALGINNWRILTPYQLYRWLYGFGNREFGYRQDGTKK